MASSPNPFDLLPQENQTIIPAGEELEILFEIPQVFLAKNDISDIESGGEIIIFVQSDGYIGSIEEDNYYSFGNSIEYPIN